jgi:hypothetical protein
MMLTFKSTSLFTRSTFLFSTLVLGLFSMQSNAEQKQVFGEYEVHYIGLSSSFLTPEVAKIYDIPRSRALGFLNISVLQKTANDELPAALNATVSGKIRNLIGQSRDIEFRRVQEGKAIYYLSTFRFDDGDMYNFDLDVVPSNAKQKNFDVKFSQRFYEED